MSRYDRQIKSAAKQIAKLGQPCTWNKPAVVANDAQPWNQVSGEPVKYQVAILFKRSTGGFAAALIHLMKGTDIPAGAPTGLMAAGSLKFVPEITDTVDRNGATLQIENIDVIAPDGTPILYIIRFA